jgi:Glycosyltransferases, probably involved in cell wall biogenesis
MKNCMALDYPKDKLKILWVTDGSNDNTNKILKEYEDVTVIYKPEREGKTTAINRGMKYVNTPFTIFTDANTNLNTEAIKEIVSQFNDERTGCVAGEKRIADKNDGNTAASGEGIYWKYESTLKKWDSELYSTVGAAGELYGIRTDLFEAMPKNTLLDDFHTFNENSHERL